MTGNGRVMGGFSRGNGGLPGLDGVEEIALVIVGDREFDLAQWFRQLLDVFPVCVGRLERAPVYPYPAFGSDPFRATANVLVAAGNGHRDVFGILQFDAIFGAGVPDRIDRREFAITFNLHRPRVIEAAPPMGDVTKMADPIK